MRVSVRLAGALALGHGARRALDLEPGATVADVLRAIDGLPAVRVARRGRLIAEDAPLEDGDELDLVVPIAGGT